MLVAVLENRRAPLLRCEAEIREASLRCIQGLDHDEEHSMAKEFSSRGKTLGHRGDYYKPILADTQVYHRAG